MTDCPSENILVELASGRLEGAQADEVHEHIDACTSCLEVLAELLRSTESAGPSSYPARYSMIEESGRGGQARVLRGYDSVTRREVAIKELLPRDDPSHKARRRFVHEARLTASLTHPGIVPVFDIGFRPDGRPFYTMQFVRGRTLADALRACGSLPERLRYLSHFLELCQAVSFAHSRGVVHRDIKPPNVVVGEFGQTILIDWGLAKLARRDAKPPLDDSEDREDAEDGGDVGDGGDGDDGDDARPPDATVAGSVIGTPAYMSPEQAAGRLEDVDERSDVFGLGAVLYEILTGRPPHTGDKLTELLTAARTVRVAPVGPDAPRELAVIVHKALALERAGRYERASDLAADVQAYLTGDRVGAYDYSSWELLRRLVRRHKRAVTAAVLGLAALMVTLAALSVALRREDHERRQAVASRAETLIEGAETAVAQRDLLEARAKLRTALETADSLEARSLWRQLAVDPLIWQVRTGSQPNSMAVSPTERRFAVAGYQPGIRLIAIDTGLVEVLHTGQVKKLAFMGDGRTLAAAGQEDGRIRLWDLGTRRARDLGSVGDAVKAMVPSPDGRALYVLTGQRRLARMDSGTGALTELPLSQPAGIGLAVHPDGRTLAVVLRTGELRLLDLATGKETPLDCPRRSDMSPTYSPDGSVLGAVGREGAICLVSRADAPPRIIDGIATGRLGFSPDSKRFAVGGADGNVRVWETATGRLLATLREGESTPALFPTWTRDGLALAVVHQDGTVRLHSTEMPPAEPGAAAGSPGMRPSLAVSPDGATIVTGSLDGRLHFLDLRSGSERVSERGHKAEVLAVAYAPDGRVASGGSDGQIRIWDSKGRPQKTLSGPGSFVSALRFAGTGRLVSVAGAFQVWDLETGALQRTIAAPGASVTPAVSGEELLLGHTDGTVSRWELGTGREVDRVSLAHDSLDAVAFTDGGRGLAAVTTRGEVLVRDAKGEVRRLAQVDCGADGCRLASDAAGERVAVGQFHGRMSVFDLARGGRVDFEGDAFQGVALTPDGHVAGISPHGVVQVWDADTGRSLWRGPLLRQSSDEVRTHEGWASLSGQPAGGTAAWRRAVETDARLAAESGDLLCLAGFDGRLELWSESRDVRLAGVAQPDLISLEASGRGCVALANRTASLLDPQGKLEVLAREATSIFARLDTILVGLDDRVLTLDGTGRTEVVDEGVSAIGRSDGGDLLVGFSHGAVEIRRPGSVLALEDTPGSPVRRIVAGPPDLVAAAFGDGTIGLWSAATGQLLHRWWLHGAATHLSLRGDRLLALTEVGQIGAWAVHAYSISYCDLLKEVWSAVPWVWEGGRPVAKSPPAGHRCASR